MTPPFAICEAVSRAKESPGRFSVMTRAREPNNRAHSASANALLPSVLESTTRISQSPSGQSCRANASSTRGMRGAPLNVQIATVAGKGIQS